MFLLKVGCSTQLLDPFCLILDKDHCHNKHIISGLHGMTRFMLCLFRLVCGRNPGLRLEFRLNPAYQGLGLALRLSCPKIKSLFKPAHCLFQHQVHN